MKPKYESEIIGNQEWITRNLDVDRFRNGDLITYIELDEEWEEAGQNGQPAWCYYDNDLENGKKYGKLYNWFAVTDERKLCPLGWKIPSDNDWTVLTSYLGGLDVAGGKLKSTGITYWQIPNAWANNLSFFTGLPSGYRDELGVFFGIGYYGLWWSSTSNGAEAWSRYVYNEFNYSTKETLSKNYGLSVRCLIE